VAKSPSNNDAKSRILAANWYDYPQCYDIAVQAYTLQEADFIVAACRKYCPFAVRRFLEPACGTGRLLRELVARGYQLIGFDLSQPSLSYLRRQLARRRLRAETFEAEMSDFRLSRPVDAAYCTGSTFRLLLTEQAARGHLRCIAGSLRPGGIYVLGFRLLPLNLDKEGDRRWTERRGETKVAVTLRVLRIDRASRIENLMVCMLVRRRSKQIRLRHEFQVRTYTAKQFKLLLDSVPLLELCDVYDFRYDVEHPLLLNDKMGYTVFVLRRRLPS
jgi:SAM-dependent methyltransferase